MKPNDEYVRVDLYLNADLTGRIGFQTSNTPLREFQPATATVAQWLDDGDVVETDEDGKPAIYVAYFTVSRRKVAEKQELAKPQRANQAAATPAPASDDIPG